MQRSDMDGVLDARFDTLPQMPQKLSRPLAWCKFTIACFRFSEVFDYFRAEGWEPKPLLVARDVRSVFNSLSQKSYGRNGITADDPPLRLRLHRFLEDWKLFRERRLPILRYEDLADDPDRVVRDSCAQLSLPWDEAMVMWPKAPEEIADAGFGNETFVRTRGGTLKQTVSPNLIQVKTAHIPPDDLTWIEETFAEFNREMRYPPHVAPTAPATPLRAVPQFENTRRYERLQRKTRVSRSIQKLTSTIARLIPGRKSPADG
jgi:hypothetical protein